MPARACLATERLKPTSALTGANREKKNTGGPGGVKKDSTG